VANGLQNLGSVVHFERDYVRTAALLDESLSVWRQLGERWSLAKTLELRGILAHDQGEWVAASTFHEESLSILREIGDLSGAAGILGELGALACEQGDYARAVTLLRQALTMRRALGDRSGQAQTLANLGRVAYAQGDVARAVDLYRQSLRVYGELGHVWGPIVCLEGLAVTAISGGHAERAAVLYGAASSLRDRLGGPLPPLFERAGHNRLAAVSRERLGEEAFAAAWAEGRAMSLEEAIELTLAPLDPTDPAGRVPDRLPAVDAWSPLSRREREVAALIARGLTNRQIAEELVISERTASTHVTNILGKLGFATRAQVAAWAGEQGLTGHL
jgi:ATP/maltotriose-dependent transcriptional regulator MalT